MLGCLSPRVSQTGAREDIMCDYTIGLDDKGMIVGLKVVLATHQFVPPPTHTHTHLSCGILMSSPLCVSLEQTTYYSNGGAFVDNSLGDMGLLMTVRRPAHPHTHAHARTRPHLHKYPAHLSFFPIHHRPCHIPPFLGVSRPARGQRVQLPHF